MKGALILLIANIVTKIIGMVFKIPLTYLIHEEGMAVFGAAYTIYSFVFIIATAGLPVAVSKMVSESEVVGNKKESKRILGVSLTVLTSLCFVGMLALFFGADMFAKAISCESASGAIKAIAPSIFFVGIVSAFRGFFQGHQNMVPTAWSEVVESLGKLIFGFGLAYYFVDLTQDVDFGATGAVLGVSLGSLFACVVIVSIFIKSKKKLFENSSDMPVNSKGKIVKKLILIAIPITIGASVFSLTSLIDLAMIMRRLKDAGFDETMSKVLYGSYSGYAVPMFNLPATLISSISISIVPAIASAYAIGDKKQAQSTASMALKVTTVFALPCAVGLSVLANPILMLVYHNPSATNSLSILGYAVVFVSLVMVSNSILQAMQKERIPVINMVIGGLFKIIINYILVGIPGININGAPIGTICCYVVILVLNLSFIIKETKIKLSIKEFIFKPVLSVIVMGASVILCTYLFRSMHYAISTLMSILIGAIVYFAVIFILKTVKYEEILMLPKGDKLATIMLKFGIITK
jgi:stage V sporulation protein B